MTMTPDEITAIDIPDTEKLKVIEAFDGSVEDFLNWQRSTLAAEVERRLSIKAAREANNQIAQAVIDAKAEMPTLFPSSEQP